MDNNKHVLDLLNLLKKKVLWLANCVENLESLLKISLITFWNLLRKLYTLLAYILT